MTCVPHFVQICRLVKKSKGEDTHRIQSALISLCFSFKGRKVDLNRLSRSSGIKEEVTGLSSIFLQNISTHQTTSCHDPEDLNIKTPRGEIISCHVSSFFVKRVHLCGCCCSVSLTHCGVNPE